MDGSQGFSRTDAIIRGRLFELEYRPGSWISGLISAARRRKLRRDGTSSRQKLRVSMAPAEAPYVTYATGLRLTKILIVVPTDGIRGRGDTGFRMALIDKGLEVSGGRDRQWCVRVRRAACGDTHGTNCHSFALGRPEEHYEVDAFCGRDLHGDFADYGRAASERGHRTAHQEHHAW